MFFQRDKIVTNQLSHVRDGPLEKLRGWWAKSRENHSLLAKYKKIYILARENYMKQNSCTLINPEKYFIHTLWYLMIPCDTLWYFVIMIPCDTFWYFVIPWDTLWYLVIPCDTLWCLVILWDTLWYFVILCDTLGYLVMPCDTLWYVLCLVTLRVLKPCTDSKIREPNLCYLIW